jgi:hypothetical protein
MLPLVLLAGSAQAAPRILVDEGHGQRFLLAGEGELQLSALAEHLRATGAKVKAGPGPITERGLRRVDGVLIAGAFSGFDPEERDALLRWVEGGGRLAVALHVPGPVVPLLGELGVITSNGVVREVGAAVLDGRDIDFTVRPSGDHPVMDGVSSIAFFGSFALLPEGEGTVVVATTGDGAWVDLNGNRQRDPLDATQRFAVVVAGQRGEGSFLVFADDAVFQNRFLTAHNERLAVNLAAWLTGK